MEALLRRLEVGVPAHLIDLLNLPLASLLDRGDYLQLGGAGIDSVAAYWNRPPKELSGILGAKGILLEGARPK